MPWFYVDQRPARARCEAILARIVEREGDPDESRAISVRIALEQVLRSIRLVFGAGPVRVAHLLIERSLAGDVLAARRLVARVIPARGHLRPVRAGAGAVVILSAGVLGAFVAPLAATLATLGLLIAYAVPFVFGADEVDRIVRTLRTRGGVKAMRRLWDIERAIRSHARDTIVARYTESRMVLDAHLDAEALVLTHVFAMRAVARWAVQSAEQELARQVLDDTRRLVDADCVPVGAGWILSEALEDATLLAGDPETLALERRALIRVAPEAR